MKKTLKGPVANLILLGGCSSAIPSVCAGCGCSQSNRLSLREYYAHITSEKAKHTGRQKRGEQGKVDEE